MFFKVCGNCMYIVTVCIFSNRLDNLSTKAFLLRPLAEGRFHCFAMCNDYSRRENLKSASF